MTHEKMLETIETAIKGMSRIAEATVVTGMVKSQPGSDHEINRQAVQAIQDMRDLARIILDKMNPPTEW